MSDSVEKPFVKVIRTCKATYAYDVNTGNILKVSQELGELLEEWEHKSKLISYNDSKKLIQRLQEEEKIFLSHIPEVVVPNLNSDVSAKENPTACSHMILNVTESCNLNCQYCIYSGLYDGRRTHSNKVMSWDIARKAIDLLAKNSKHSNETLILGFYGGEPLLRFDFIRDCVEYANLQFGDFPHLFSITTNGTLLKEDIIDYLVANKFIITISIDGPKEIQDKNRRYINGKGTFQEVIKSIDKLRERCGEEYFRDFVNLSSVVTPPYNFNLLNEFFPSYLTCIRLSTPEYIPELYNTMSVHQASGWESLAEAMKDFCLNKYIQKDFRLAGIGVPYELFGKELRKIHNRPLDQPIKDTQRVLGFCQPGKGRAFVSCDGKIYLCERVEGNENMLIGTVENGIEPDKVIKIINDVSRLDYSRCKNCWLINLCSLCFAHIVNGNSYSTEKWQFSCEGLKNHYAAAFKLYCEIMEEDESALDFLVPKQIATYR